MVLNNKSFKNISHIIIEYSYTPFLNLCNLIFKKIDWLYFSNGSLSPTKCGIFPYGTGEPVSRVTEKKNTDLEESKDVVNDLPEPVKKA